MQTNFVIDLGEKARVPIISFSATSPSLTSLPSTYFFRATQIDSSQVKAIGAIIKAFGWREAVPIYIDNEYGNGVLPYLIDALQIVEARVPYRSAISGSATDDQIEKELFKLMTMQTRVFIVHMPGPLGSRLFAKAQKLGMMNEGYVWIMTDGLSNILSSINASVISSMQGALGVRTYVPKTKEIVTFRDRWKKQFHQQNPTIIDVELDVFALWAYDAAYALAMAVEELGTSSFVFQTTISSTNSSSDLETLGVSQNGYQLSRSLAKTKFRGLAGNFSFDNGQLQSSIFEILNVIGAGARAIGFWTPENGLVRNLIINLTNTSVPNLGFVIWPGEHGSIPKGWEIPTNGKKLRVGVPVKYGFTEFVKVVDDNSTNTTPDVITGFCIDVFNAAMEGLPYAVTYEFIPFAYLNGSSAGTYDDLVYQVFLGDYDALAADSTIRANRSLYVDFTLPYTESGVVMVVPMKDKNRIKNAWIFLKPLTWDLWLASFFSFVFIGFVVWLLEHRVNEDFRGPPSHQVGTGLWFSFSTMVFAQRERVVSNLSRFVVIVWVFVVLILTQSYTASLTSLLTVQKLEPTYTNISHLISNTKEYVGCLDGSFVCDLLQQGFHASNIRKYKSAQECNQLLINGSQNGGIAAAIDETPNMKLFLANYCSNYTMIGPIIKTDGFAFVFPKGSPLVPDVSRSILQFTEGDLMKELERKWFGNETACSVSNPMVSDSSSLSLDRFWGLFLIAGVTSLLALIIFVASFIWSYQHKGIRVMLEVFDCKDLSSHTFKKKSLGDQFERSPSCSSYSISPSNFSHSNRTDITEMGEQAILHAGQVEFPASVLDLPNSKIPTAPQSIQENN
ncbi:glutamate receptor 2.7-like isoform X2 [Rosa rugosa]|nr:glutamate receptor 2.7-like isoform X2 [Rosa rugosa]